MASVALADAIIAAWDTKYEADFWRPITGIRGAANDGNPNTAADPNWEYLRCPRRRSASATDDFTPPFPAYISGHATMGGAIFKTLELFYGTNDFAAADAAIGVDPVTGTVHAAFDGTRQRLVPETTSASRRLARSAPAWKTRPKAKTA